jgi:hypothetical protein
MAKSAKNNLGGRSTQEHEEGRPLSILSVKGFKSHRDTTRLELGPLTLLAGANSSGKSGAMQALLLLKQTIEAAYDPGPLKLDGPNVEFTSPDQFLWTAPGQPPSDSFDIGLTLPGPIQVNLTFEKLGPSSISIRESTYVEGERTVTLRENMSQKDFPKSAVDIENINAFLRRTGSPDKATISVKRERCFLVPRIALGGNESFFPPGSGLFEAHATLTKVLRQAFHLPGLRGNPLRLYKAAGTAEAFPGLFQDYTASLISRWIVTSDPRLDTLNESLERLGLTWKVQAKVKDATTVEVLVGRTPAARRGGASDLVNIADVGFGVSQSLPVLVALIAANPGQLVYIEQPEIHLHPRAQVALAELIAATVKRGVQVVVETHSELLLIGIQKAVADGLLPCTKVRLHWFHRDDQGATIVTSARLDASGAFGDWPVDFFDVAGELEEAHQKAAFSRLQK